MYLFKTIYSFPLPLVYYLPRLFLMLDGIDFSLLGDIALAIPGKQVSRVVRIVTYGVLQLVTARPIANANTRTCVLRFIVVPSSLVLRSL